MTSQFHVTAAPMSRTRKLPPATPADAAAEMRRQLVNAAIADLLARRTRGEHINDSAVIEAHPELQPELGAELRAMQEMHRIFLSARKAGPIASESQVLTPGSSGVAVWPSDERSEPVRAVAIQGYTILQEISTGGQGTVFQGTQDATGRAVAIKVIPGGLLTGSRHRARFDREAGILAKLDHPNIVGILDRGRTDDGSLFLVMPLIDGKSLDDYMQRLGKEAKPDKSALLRLFIQILHAIGEAHRQGIIHRDLKPANIRLDQHGRPHILDFGLARLQGDGGDDMRAITMTGQIVGSLPWTSPEQVLHKTGEVDARTDLYALGVILYQALTETFPYTVIGSVREVLDNIANAVPVPPSETKVGALRGVDARLDAIVLRTLAKSPADRYQSAQELADDLERYLAGKPLTTKIEHPFLRRYRREMLFIAIMVVLGGVAVVVWNMNRHIQVQVDETSNTVGMRLLRLPRGEFNMGSPPLEAGHEPSEKERWVRIEHNFLISATEVTQKQYLAVMGELPAEIQVRGDALPVNYVTWNEAREFCRRLSELEKRKYRLPKEAEWEYACRADGRSMRYAGPLDDMGWYSGNSGARVHVVATKSPNYWGLYDMHGNVSEWCEDADKAIESESVTLRLLRGGGILSVDTECRSATRVLRPVDARRSDVGFRIVAEL